MLFAAKNYLFLLLIIPFLVFAYIIAQNIRKKRLEKFSKIYLSKNLISLKLKEKQILKFALKVIALTFFIIALASPKFGSKMLEVKRKGIEIIIAIDTSLSMLAEDIKPNRIKMAKSELARIIDSISNNKIGIICFAGSSFLQCPLTLDSNAAKLFLDFVDVGIIPDPGTNIESAIVLAQKSFSEKTKTNKVLILLTDGEDLENNPLDAAKKAAENGIQIFTIGFGSQEGELIPIRDENGNLKDYKKDKDGKTVTSKLDQNLLKQIALETKGKYYYSKNGYLDVESIAKEINSLEKENLKSKINKQYQYKFYYFLGFGLLLLLIEMFLKES